jgi:predicted Zn-dependent protease
MSPRNHARRLLAAFVLSGLACALGPTSARAQAPAPELPKKEISEAASAGFAKLRPLLEAKSYPGALALVEQLLAAAEPASYDAYLLWQIQAQILLNQNKLTEAIRPLERSHALAEGNARFFDAATHLERLHLLAQLYSQEGAAQKTPAAQRTGYEKALAYTREWLARSPKPSADIANSAGSLLYHLATLDAAKPDLPRLREAADFAREALILSPNSGPQARLLLVACLRQLGDNASAAEHLEVLAAADPKNASIWSQLQGLYQNAAEEAKDTAAARASNIRSLLVIERAQAAGQLLSPRDNYMKVALLYNLGQFVRAADLLETGLADGTLENSKRNWELLGSAYQRFGREDRALDAAQRALAKFPEDGALEFSLARLLHEAGKTEEAYSRGRSALAKPGLDKPGQTRLYLAFLAYELQRYDEAARWIAEARAGGDVPAASIDPLDRAVTEAIAQREALQKS